MTPFAGSTDLGGLVPRNLAYQKNRSVGSRRCTDYVAEAFVHSAAMGREGVDRVIDEQLARFRVFNENQRPHAHFVDLTTTAPANDLLERVSNAVSNLVSRVVRAPPTPIVPGTDEGSISVEP